MLSDTVGSLSMLPLEDDGVVDHNLKVLLPLTTSSSPCETLCRQVYKTTNIRVADLSIIPLHIGAHTQGLSMLCTFLVHLCNRCDPSLAAAYAIAEQGAHIESIKRSRVNLPSDDLILIAADIIKGKI